MFQVCGVLQKRQVASSTGLQISRCDFLTNNEIFRSLKLSDVIKASSEEARKIPFSDPVIKDICRHISVIWARVMGTDESQVKIRNQIWSTSVMLGPPSLWVTINPLDANDPITQVIAGKDIDLANFMSSDGPNHETRAATMATYPYTVFLGL